ncbi:MAG: glycosyltransferase family 9 protein [Patescibacteria group bacterium]
MKKAPPIDLYKMLNGREIKFDCCYFNGAKPCQFSSVCNSCDSYRPMGKRILVIKLASAGDVLRTTALLPALKVKFPDSYVTWLTKEPANELLELSPYIDRILTYGLESATLLQVESFDLVISLDKASEAASLAELVKAAAKCGYGLNEKGKIYPFNKKAEYSFLLGLDNELKFSINKKTYQEIMFEAVGLPYNNERYELRLGPRELDFAAEFFKRQNLSSSDFIIGINTGAGKIFANKSLKPARIVELIGLLYERLNTNIKILLLGGPLEKDINGTILKKLTDHKIIDSGHENTIREFCSLVNLCSAVISADTLALHIAVALNKAAIALFGPTCPQEIDLYNRGRKIITKSECAPCYKNICDKNVTCMDRIDLNEVVGAIKELEPICSKGHERY